MPPKAKKDPNKPKGVKSAYAFFVESKGMSRESNLVFAEFSKQCGANWAEMTAEDKAPFEKLSQEDRVRHEEEMRTYVPPIEVYHIDSDDDEVPMPRKRKKRRKKDPNAPKRPKSSYFCFAGDVRPRIMEENPDMKITQVMSLVGEMWREMDDNDKKPFEELAAKDRERYEKEVEAYKCCVVVPSYY